MNITVEKQENNTATVNIEVPADKVSTERNEIVKGFTKQAKLPGFRPGKTPTSVVEKRYASEIKEELTSRLVNEGVSEAIRSEDLKVLQVRVPEEPVFSDAGTLSFTTNIILSPEFELPEYKGLNIEVPNADVTEKEMELALEDLRQRFAEHEDVERELTDGDFAVIDFTSSLDGKPLEEALGKSAGFLDGREGHWVKIDEESFLPGFGPQLKGLNIDDKKEVSITIPEEFPLEDVRGAEIVFDVTVKGVKVQQLPELNDEFAAKLIPEKGMDDLKEVMSEQLEQEKTRRIADSKVNQIVEQLGESVEFDLPSELVEAEVAGNKQDMVQRGLRQGMTPEMLHEQEAEIEKVATEQAHSSLKTNFILQEIANVEKIEVEDQDMIQRIAAMAEEAKTPVQKFIKELQKENRIDSVRNSVLIGKTIDFLVESAEVSEVESTENDE